MNKNLRLNLVALAATAALVSGLESTHVVGLTALGLLVVGLFAWVVVEWTRSTRVIPHTGDVVGHVYARLIVGILAILFMTVGGVVAVVGHVLLIVAAVSLTAVVVDLVTWLREVGGER